MQSGLNNLYFMTHPALTPFIAHYTVSYPSDSLGAGMVSLIPDASGCLIFKYHDHGFRGYFWGSTTRITRVRRNANAGCTTLFVEFRPGGSHALLGLDAAEYTDLQIALEDAAPKLYASMIELFSGDRETHALIKRLDEFFLDCLVRSRWAGAQRDVTALLTGFSGSPSVRELSEQTCYSSRHLSRLVKPVIGMGIKQYLRMVRINRTIQEMKGLDRPLTALAHEMGFYDQAHLNHEFKQVCGVSPQEYQAKMSDFYNEEFKF